MTLLNRIRRALLALLLAGTAAGAQAAGRLLPARCMHPARR